MVNNAIMEKLIPITQEENEILKNSGAIDSSIYTVSGGNTVSSKKLLDMGKLITIRPHTRFIDFPEHTHDFIEVVYMCSGSTVHIINGKEVVLREGELLFLNMYAKQRILRSGENDIAVNFIILPQFFDSVLSMLGEEETPLKAFIIDCLGKKSSDNSFLHFKVSDILPIQNLIENLLYTFISDTPNKRHVNQTTIGLLFLHLINHTDRLVVEKSADALLIEVFRYIEENYVNSSLSDLAKLLHYDFYWLSREIKRTTGKTYTELLHEKRLSQAAFLLRTTKIKISDVSRAVGYENISYFHRIFAERFGLSPKKYRDCK